MGAHAVAAGSGGCSSPVTPGQTVTVTSEFPQCLPRYQFIDQPVWKDEQLDELCADCPRPGSNLGQQIRSQTC